MPFHRSSGILLHPTSLPSRFGIGDLGPEGFQFVDFLADTAQQYWQLLPLGPTGYGDSPYMCFSSMAGNHVLISPEILVEEGLLSNEDLENLPQYPLRIDYGGVIHDRLPLLRKASDNFQRNASNEDRIAFDHFCDQNSNWLEDYSLFMSIKQSRNLEPWVTWDPDLVQRQPQALARFKTRFADLIVFHKFLQFEFLRQISKLKHYANERGIRLIGDLPIYVAHDSAEVWAHPEYFCMNAETGYPTHVAGVPPDYFSSDGQLWGNPIYNWEHLQADGFEWWVQRLQTMLTYVDMVRIDHFRGFDAYWSVAYGESTAINGSWVQAPGSALLDVLRNRLGQLPIIAEDLGIITPQVEALRDRFDLPGMKILQFAFGDKPENPYLPHNYSHNFVVYTGTHDNDTTIGWFHSLSLQEQEAIRSYLGCAGAGGIHWDIIRLAFRSVADVAIVPLQDVLGLDGDARMNLPSSRQGNWTWRYDRQRLTSEVRARLRDLTEMYGRAPSDSMV